MNETENKLYDYAQSVEWDRTLMRYFICGDITLNEFNELEGHDSIDKIRLFIKKYKTQKKDTIIIL